MQFRNEWGKLGWEIYKEEGGGGLGYDTTLHMKKPI